MSNPPLVIFETNEDSSFDLNDDFRKKKTIDI